MGINMDLDFTTLSDREIAEKLFNQFGTQLFSYAMRSWKLNEDDIWEILYETLYRFINSYAGHSFSSEKQIESLIWKIFKNKLRDKYRQRKKIEEHYQEVAYYEEILANNTTGQAEQDKSFWLNHSEQALIHENTENPILPELEAILDKLEDWERQLVISRANEIPYKQIEEMTGKKTDFLKVHYQRLKQRISKKLEESIYRKGEGHG